MSTGADENIDLATVEGFGEEWTRFSFKDRPAAELDDAFEDYFSLFPWESLPHNAIGFDAGCGSGRWAARVAPRVGTLHCVDASSSALQVTQANLSGHSNVQLHLAGIADIPLPDSSMDFGYSLGVLHHMPDTQAGLSACVRKLKPGAPFLLYLYYSLDNRSALYRGIWKATDMLRRHVSALPFATRRAVSEVIAHTVYWPLARSALLAERLTGRDVSAIPLASYRHRTLYVMRNDALDRFGTRLEQRFSREEIAEMMERAGLTGIGFREGPPFWCAVGRRA
ncbi:MAG: class I SAM-dependent methyltransferase [Polyangiaceae bacterium]|nr:class I SAM-dependent methyltransferase [Polyangiaceae bacterium]